MIKMLEEDGLDQEWQGGEKARVNGIEAFYRGFQKVINTFFVLNEHWITQIIAFLSLGRTLYNFSVIFLPQTEENIMHRTFKEKKKRKNI